MTAPYSIALPDGMSAVTFKVAIIDDDLVDSGRKLDVTLTGNSAGYTLGMDGGNNGKTIALNIKDDEVQITIEELEGRWTMDETYYNNQTRQYTVTVEKIDETHVAITGLGNYSGTSARTLIAEVDLTSKVKYAYIPAQEIQPSLNPNYVTYFSWSAYMWYDVDLEEVPILLDKDENDVITWSFGWDSAHRLYGYAFWGAPVATPQNITVYFSIGGIPGTMYK